MFNSSNIFKNPVIILAKLPTILFVMKSLKNIKAGWARGVINLRLQRLAGERSMQKFCLGPGQYRGRKCERGTPN